MDGLKTGLIGAGVFAGYHASKIASAEAVDFIGLYDPDQARTGALASTYNARAFASQAELLKECEAVIIACPAIYHFAAVKAALEVNCHVLVEKPLALTGAEADDLVALARRRGLILQVGHQERFVLEAMGLSAIPEIPLSIEAVREGPPAPDGRAGDVSVIFDLMIHDLDMVVKLLGLSNPEAVEIRARGAREHSAHLDWAEVDLTYGGASSQVRAQLRASRCATARARTMRLTYPSGQIAIDFLTRQVENTTPFAVEADISGLLPDPLGAADAAFFQAARGLAPCRVPGLEAARAVHLAERAEALCLVSDATQSQVSPVSALPSFA